MEIIKDKKWPVADLVRLYDSVGWSAYTKDRQKMGKLLEGAFASWSLVKQGQLIGLCRAISDGASVAYIQDLLVDPVHQGQGYGAALLAAAMEEFKDLRQIVLVTDIHSAEGFYKKVGLSTIAENDGVCFVRYNMKA